MDNIIVKFYYMLKTSNALDTIIFKSFFFLKKKIKKQKDVTTLKIKQ